MRRAKPSNLGRQSKHGQLTSTTQRWAAVKHLSLAAALSRGLRVGYRMATTPYNPQSDEELPPDDEPILDSTGVNLGRERHTATVLVARERGTLDGQTSRIRWSLVGFTGLLLSTVAALIVGSLKVGLRPLDDLAGQVQDLDAKSLDRRVNLALPSRELAPVVEQLNQLLTRLENAFDRERQLTSDIAHAHHLAGALKSAHSVGRPGVDRDHGPGQCCPTNFSAVRVESVRFCDQAVRSGVRTGPGAVFARTG